MNKLLAYITICLSPEDKLKDSNLTHQRMILAILAMFMALTRFHHEGTAFTLPDASLAVFFLAGFYCNTLRCFFILLGVAFVVDYLAIVSFAVDGYCISPAYGFLIPTYGVMWLAGNWFFRQPRQGLMAACGLKLVAALLVSASTAFMLSNGSFYWFSGKFFGVSLLEYVDGVYGLYLPYLGAATLYTIIGFGIESGVCWLTHEVLSVEEGSYFS
jgi:hypothetical protein